MILSRFLVLHLPTLATDRLRQTEPALRDKSLAAWTTIGNRRVLTAADAPGARLYAGQALADVQAMNPESVLRPAEPDADLALLHRLALWALQFTPESADGLVLNIAGCSELFGNEAVLLKRIITGLPRSGIAACAVMKRVLGRTLGVPLFQEQAMRVAIVAAGLTPSEADDLRRAMATFKYTQGVSVYRDRLVGGMVRRGYDPALAERVFKQIEGFGSYGFPESHAASFAHLAYASAWVKCHHPTVFAAALLNSQPMGFYAPAQIVRDAQGHGTRVRPVCVNASEWDSTLEPDPSSAEEFALRLGLRLTVGLAEENGRRIAKVRRSGNGSPYGSVEEVARRANIGRKATEALAEADAFAGLGVSRRDAMWKAKAIERDIPPLLLLAGEAAGLGEPALIRSPPLHCRWRRTDNRRCWITWLGLSLRQHPVALLRKQLGQLGLQDTRWLGTARPGSWIKVPGLVLMRQRPGTAKGIVFITIEDEFGTANLVVYADVGARDRAAMIGARLLVAEGRVERETERAEVPITHLICRRLVDRSDLLGGLMQSKVGSGWGGAGLLLDDKVRRPEPGSPRPEHTSCQGVANLGDMHARSGQFDIGCYNTQTEMARAKERR